MAKNEERSELARACYPFALARLKRSDSPVVAAADAYECAEAFLGYDPEAAAEEVEALRANVEEHLPLTKEQEGAPKQQAKDDRTAAREATAKQEPGHHPLTPGQKRAAKEAVADVRKETAPAVEADRS